MPAAEPAAVSCDGDALAFSGGLLRDAVASLWRQALPRAAGVRRIDLQAVTRVDSAGVALLAELAARSGGELVLDGDPPGLAPLRAAYRLSPSLAFAL
jgi:phospholipid transport system transporter-binding protein